MRKIHETLAKLQHFALKPQDFITEWEITMRYVQGRLPDLGEVLGLEELGNGNYSTVYALSDRTVLKVNNRERDEAFWYYAKLCVELAPTNPYLPRIYRCLNFGNLKAYVIERLEPRVFCDYHIKGIVQNIEWLQDICRQGVPLTVGCPHLQQILTDKRFPDFCDAGGNNVMLRGDQLVFTDPCG